MPAVPRRSKDDPHAFSLIELIIVIVIIGFIAALAIPRLSQGSEAAAENALRNNLKHLRTAIELYAAEHGGAYPGLHKADGSQEGTGAPADFRKQLKRCSDETGDIGSCKAPRVYGPYLITIPEVTVGPNAEKNANGIEFSIVNPLKVDVGSNKGWMYNPQTGEIIANTDEVDSSGVPYRDY